MNDSMSDVIIDVDDVDDVDDDDPTSDVVGRGSKFRKRELNRKK